MGKIIKWFLFEKEKRMEYKIIKASEVDRLEELVNLAISIEGWIPQGGLIWGGSWTDQDGRRMEKYLQAMIKEENAQ